MSVQASSQNPLASAMGRFRMGLMVHRRPRDAATGEWGGRAREREG